jgi:hypothetical protein
MVMLIPALFLFGIHVVFFKIPGVGFVTLPRIYWWSLAALTVAYFIANGKIYAHFGRAFWYAAVLVLMMAYALLSLIWVKNRESSLDTFWFQFSGVAAACYIAAVVHNFKDLRVFLRVLTICYSIVVIIGVIEIYSGIYLFGPGELAYSMRDIYGFHFPYTVFYNTNDHATFVTLFAPFAVFTAIEWVSGVKGKIFGVALASVAFFNVLCGRARNCFLTIICFMVVLLLICFIKKSLRVYAGTVTAIFAALPLSYLVIKMTELASGSMIAKLGTINTNDHSISMRFEMTAGGFKMAYAYHLLGVGVGSSVPLMPDFSSLHAINLHDMPLQIFVEYGIIIFALYAVMTVLLAKDFLKRRPQTQKGEIFCVLSFLTVLCFQIVGMQPSDAMHIYAIWMIFGIWFASVKLLNSDSAYGFAMHLKKFKTTKQGV